jgi:Holliday junction resolvase RusA-like endonuclease
MSTQEPDSGQGRLLATLHVSGMNPISTRRAKGFPPWKEELKKAASRARKEMDTKGRGPYSLEVEMRLCPQYGNLGSDLDNYIKAIQDALADAHVFGETTQLPGVMRGDERIDHLVMRRIIVPTTQEAGVIARVFTIE